MKRLLTSHDFQAAGDYARDLVGWSVTANRAAREELDKLLDESIAAVEDELFGREQERRRPKAEKPQKIWIFG